MPIALHITSENTDDLRVHIVYRGDLDSAPWTRPWSARSSADRSLVLEVDADLLGAGRFELSEVSYVLDTLDPDAKGDPVPLDISRFDCRITESGALSKIDILYQVRAGGEFARDISLRATTERDLTVSAHAHIMGPAEMPVGEFHALSK